VCGWLMPITNMQSALNLIDQGGPIRVMGVSRSYSFCSIFLEPVPSLLVA
jgi:hypothetical protein